MQLLRMLAATVIAATALVMPSPAFAQTTAPPTPSCAVKPSNSSSGGSNSTTMAPAAELLIGVVIFDNTAALDFIGPTTYFELLPFFSRPVRIISIANRTGRIQPNSLMPQHATVAYTDAPTKLDILLIPGGPGDALVIKDDDFIDYLATAAEQSTHVLSVCTGADILASTGALDGRNATTNKRKFKAIAAKHPEVNWVRKARWVVDGKFWTSSGVSAGLDMAHAFITELCGVTIADRMARNTEIVPITDPSNDPFEFVIDLS